MCIGESFAWMEGILLIATLAQRFQFSLAPTAQMVCEPRVTLRPKYGLPVIIHRRQQFTWNKPFLSKMASGEIKPARLASSRPGD
jgi:hypothetical protein